MEKALQGLQNEIEIIKRIVNGYLASNPALKEYRLDSLTIMRAQDMDSNLEQIADIASSHNDIEHKHSNLGQLELRECKICHDSQGRAYCYFGPNGCPR